MALTALWVSTASVSERCGSNIRRGYQLARLARRRGSTPPGSGLASKSTTLSAGLSEQHGEDAGQSPLVVQEGTQFSLPRASA